MAPDSLSENGRNGNEREHIRVVAVIQARMGSSRLPGKVLRPVVGEPLLWHIVHRLKACRLIERNFHKAVRPSGRPRAFPLEYSA